MRYIEEDTTEYISEEPESIDEVIQDRVDAELCGVPLCQDKKWTFLR